MAPEALKTPLRSSPQYLTRLLLPCSPSSSGTKHQHQPHWSTAAAGARSWARTPACTGSLGRDAWKLTLFPVECPVTGSPAPICSVLLRAKHEHREPCVAPQRGEGLRVPLLWPEVPGASRRVTSAPAPAPPCSSSSPFSPATLPKSHSNNPRSCSSDHRVGLVTVQNPLPEPQGISPAIIKDSFT